MIQFSQFLTLGLKAGSNTALCCGIKFSFVFTVAYQLAIQCFAGPVRTSQTIGRSAFSCDISFFVRCLFFFDFRITERAGPCFIDASDNDTAAIIIHDNRNFEYSGCSYLLMFCLILLIFMAPNPTIPIRVPMSFFQIDLSEISVLRQRSSTLDFQCYLSLTLTLS